MSKPKLPAEQRHSRQTYVSLRDKERARVEALAEAEGVSISAVIRRAVLKELRGRATVVLEETR